MAVNCICDKYSRKITLEILQKFLKALCEEDLGHELQQISSFLAVTWMKLN